MSFEISQKTLERLEWAQVLERLAVHARTPQARREIVGRDTDALPGAAIFSPDDTGMRESLAETREALAVLADAPAPLSGASDLSQSLDRVRKGGVLDVEALRRVASTLGALQTAARFLGERSDKAPHLAALADQIAPNTPLRTQIEAVIEEKLPPEVRAVMLQNDTRALTAVMQAPMSDLSAVLDHIAVPALFYVGEEDARLKPLRDCAQHAGAQFVSLPGLNHGQGFMQSEPVLAGIRGFLRSTAVRSAI